MQDTRPAAGRGDLDGDAEEHPLTFRAEYSGSFFGGVAAKYGDFAGALLALVFGLAVLGDVAVSNW